MWLIPKPCFEQRLSTGEAVTLGARSRTLTRPFEASRMRVAPMPGVAQRWHSHSVSRIRVSTTVEGELLAQARKT